MFLHVFNIAAISSLAAVISNPDGKFVYSQNTLPLISPSSLAKKTNYGPDSIVEDGDGVIPIPPSYFLNQDPKQNKDLLKQISSITGENADEIYNILQAFGLLDEEGEPEEVVGGLEEEDMEALNNLGGTLGITSLNFMGTEPPRMQMMSSGIGTSAEPDNDLKTIKIINVESKAETTKDEITPKVIEILKASRNNYGTRKIKVELKKLG